MPADAHSTVSALDLADDGDEVSAAWRPYLRCILTTS
jgi:hypothetical protein